MMKDKLEVMLAALDVARNGVPLKFDPDDWYDALSEIKKENARLREALEWYADQNNYSLEHAPITCDRSYNVIFAVPDCGSRARKALGKE